MKNWYYSIQMLITYVAVFVWWKFYPSRISFLAVGGIAIATLAIGFWRAYKHGYFTNRVDFCLHAYVIFDLLLETVAFELFRVFGPNGAFAVVRQFHDNTNFFGCTAAFVLLLGGYRWYALNSRSTEKVADGAAYGQTGI